MRILTTSIAALALGLAACATEAAAPETCTAWTCAEANATCGVIPDGCGGTLDCGPCSEDAGECPPSTCELENVECGEVSDGCGGRLDCGGCAEQGEQCIEGACVQTDCMGVAENACGGCRALPVQPGAPCPIEGTAYCDYWGDVTCESEEITLPATSDADDSWREVTGALQGFEWPDGQHGVGDQDAFRVFVDDTFWGLMQPEFEYTHSGTKNTQVCATVQREAGSLFEWVPAQCADEPLTFGSFGCCKDVSAALPGMTFQLKLGLGVPNPGDDNMTVRMTVRADGDDGAAFATTYRLRYRF